MSCRLPYAPLLDTARKGLYRIDKRQRYAGFISAFFVSAI